MLALMLSALLCLSLCAGDSWIAPSDWFTESGRLFVWQLRLPRSLAVVLVGASLAVCGVVMQALFTNPLAEPGLLGVSNGAGIGLVLGVLLGSGSLWSLGLAAMARCTDNYAHPAAFCPSSALGHPAIAYRRSAGDYL
ncbi:UNVERIFIED_ORG: ABC-type cobalamin transport system permease subunit [Pantoea brenneri]|nr:ABC-type cobalamin transport system permease subunit [Pantoea brenneri]